MSSFVLFYELYDCRAYFIVIIKESALFYIIALDSCQEIVTFVSVLNESAMALTHTQRFQALQMYNEGVSPELIAVLMNVSLEQVKRDLNKYLTF